MTIYLVAWPPHDSNKQSTRMTNLAQYWLCSPRGIPCYTRCQSRADPNLVLTSASTSGILSQVARLRILVQETSLLLNPHLDRTVYAPASCQVGCLQVSAHLPFSPATRLCQKLSWLPWQPPSPFHNYIALPHSAVLGSFPTTLSFHGVPAKPGLALLLSLMTHHQEPLWQPSSQPSSQPRASKQVSGPASDLASGLAGSEESGKRRIMPCAERVTCSPFWQHADFQIARLLTCVPATRMNNVRCMLPFCFITALVTAHLSSVTRTVGLG